MIGLHRALGLSQGTPPAADAAQPADSWEEFAPNEPPGTAAAPVKCDSPQLIAPARPATEPPSIPVPILTGFNAVDTEEQPAARSRKPLWIAAAAMLALAAGAAAYLRTPAGGQITTFTVDRGALNQVVAARGRIEPAAELEMAARMIGRIDSVMVEEGSRVEAGQLLAVMEDDEIKAQLSQAEGRLRQANARFADLQAGARPEEIEAARARVTEQEAVLREADGQLQRQTRLNAAGLIATMQLEEAQLRRDVAAAQHRSAREHLALLQSGARPEELRAAKEAIATAQSEVDQVHAQLAFTQVVAPVSGVVTRTFMSSGEVVVLQRPQPILILADTSRVFVRAEVDESEIGKIQIGQVALVRLSGQPGKIFRGTVAEIATSAGRKTITGESAAEIQDTKVVAVRVELPKTEDWTFGVTASVEVVVVDRPNVTRVPKRALVRENGGAYVDVQTASGVERRAVKIGVEDDEFVEIISGVGEGDLVHVAGRG